MFRRTCLSLATACSLALAQTPPPVLFRSMEKRMVEMHSYDFADTSLQLGDIDGDGDVDFWVTVQGQDRLYRNDGRGVFEDVTLTHMAIETNLSRAGVFVDVDGDGDLDFVQGNVGQDRLWRNQGNGVFVDVTATTMPVAYSDTRALCAGDLDGDGDQDLLVLQNFPTPSYDVTLLRNDGTGVFSAEATTLPTMASGYCDLELGDLDGDGDLDLIYLDVPGANGVRYFANGGTGNFTDVTAARLTPPIPHAFDVTLCDLDGDGDLDLVSADKGPLGDRFYRNSGTGVLVDANDPLLGTLQHSGVSATDMDGDGIRDLVLVDLSPWTPALQVVTNSGVGTFTLLPPPAASRLVHELVMADFALADVDGDGDQDFLVACNANDHVGPAVGRNRERWFANDGTGELIPTDDAHTPLANDRTEIADVDLDGLPDIVTFGRQPMGLFRNRGLRRFDADPSAFPPLVGVGAIATADFDGDGLPDLFVGMASAVPLASRLLRGTGNGFVDATAGSLPGLAATCESVGVGDLDGDGDVDVVVADRFGASHLLVNDGAGVFTQAPNFGASVTDSRTVQLVDLDGDGDLDCLYAGVNYAEVKLFENQGGLQFQLRTTLTFQPEVMAARAADLDGNGLPELCIVSWSLPLTIGVRSGAWSYTMVPSTIFPFGAGELDLEIFDFEGDGDLDVATVAAFATDGLILLNDGAGQLTAAPDRWIHTHFGTNLSAGDLDLDGDTDLVTTDQVGTIYWNQQVAMNAVDPAELGRRFRIELTCRPGSLPSPALAAIAFSPSPLMQLVPGLQGLSGLDPNGAVWMGVHTIPAGSGVKNVDLVVANLPALSGLTLWGQAVVFDPATSQLRLTNTTFDVIR